MEIMIIFQYRIYRSDLELNPHIIYCFGDNDQREGLGGQAKECRGEKNAWGIRTKRAPDNEDSSFYTDDGDDLAKVVADFELLEEEILSRGGVVVFPTDGFGTGLADLKNRAPGIHAWIEDRVVELVEKYGSP